MRSALYKRKESLKKLHRRIENITVNNFKKVLTFLSCNFVTTFAATQDSLSYTFTFLNSNFVTSFVK
jgi:hypothetical protein